MRLDVYVRYRTEEEAGKVTYKLINVIVLGISRIRQ